MATSWTKMLCLTLLVLASLQGCRGEDQDSMNQAALVTTMKEVNNPLQCFGDTTQEILRLQKENSNALRDLHSLPDMMLQIKEQVNQQNEKLECVNRENAVFHRVELLTQENTNLKTQLEKQKQMVDTLNKEIENQKNKLATEEEKVQDVESRLQESQRLVEELEKKVEELNATMESSEQQMSACLVPEKAPEDIQEVKKAVQAYSRSGDWAALERGLDAVLDHSSEVYSQLQAGSMWSVGYRGHTQLASLLLCAGLPVDTGDSYGDTMLHGAAGGGQLQLVELLLDRGASVHVRGWNDRTPLMRAARGGHLEVAQRLVQAGTDTTASDKVGNTALDDARSFGHTAVVQYLQQYPH